MAMSGATGAIQVYVPPNTEFTHTLPTQFTYFSGSKAGVRQTFGLSCADLMALYNKFNLNIQADLKGTDYHELVKFLQRCDTQLKDIEKTAQYRDDAAIAKGMISSGHIPLILSEISGAAIFEVAARALTEEDVSFYCKEKPMAKKQGEEYLKKQAMMAAIAQLRENVNQLRQRVPEGSLFYACNAQFDLTGTFIGNINRLLEEMKRNNKRVYEHVCIQGAVNNPGLKEIVEQRKKTVAAQETISNIAYQALIDYAGQELGITKDTKEMELTEDQDVKLQAILPLIAYLNSSTNPFARNGLFGAVVTNPFHEEALAAYRAHESQMTVSLPEESQSAYPPQSSVEFTDKQIGRLLFGAKPKPAAAHRCFRFISQCSKSSGERRCAYRRL
jgi:hypothetical protein